MTPMPTDVTDIGKELYDGVAPLAEEDEANSWDLLRYCDALISQAQPIRDQASDRSDTELGWSIMMDVNNCPAYGLDWLSQFAGVDLSRLRKGINVLSRNEFVDPSFEYDTLGSTPASYALNNSTGVTGSTLTVSETWASIGKRSIKYIGKKNNNVEERRMGWKLQGSSSYIPVEAAQWLTVQGKLNVVKVPSKGFNIRVQWYKADGSTQISEVEVTHLNEGVAGIQSVQHSFQAPEHASFAQVSILAVSNVAEQEVEFFSDELMAMLSAAAPSLPIEYVDGDQAECSWVGTPGQSNSIKSVEQTEEQFAENKRFRIKELPASRRGTPSAIVKAAQQYLIGDKTVVLQERPGGNPWRLVVITYTAETPNEKLVKEAIEEQLPAGIVLEYSVIPGADWLLVRTEYETWQQVKEAFVTWGGVRLNKPGT